LDNISRACTQLLPLLAQEPAVLGKLCQLALLLRQAAGTTAADEGWLKVESCTAYV